MVCHDMFLAPMFVDTVMLMACGKLIGTGSAVDVLTPANIADSFGVDVHIDWAGEKCVWAALTK